MPKVIIFLTDGFEEMEALVPADILHRAGVKVSLLSITGKLEVTGSHDIKVVADGLFDKNTDISDADMLILPGGPGASSYIENRALTDALQAQHVKDKYIAAICAAPVTLGKLGLLKDKAATCYPAMEGDLIAAVKKQDAVVTDGNITTGRAAGASAEFGLKLAELLVGSEVATKVKNAMYLY